MPDPSELPEPTDDAPEYSPLERDVTREGTTVRVRIYRGREDPGWILEIEDETGGSTVWDDLFDSDQEALDEALKTIHEEGIHSFAESQRDGTDRRALWDLATAQPAIAELRRTLDSSDTLSFHAACGVFAAVASTPELSSPSEWLELIQADHVFKDSTDVQRFTLGLMNLYSEVLSSVTEHGAHCCPPAEDHDAVREFCAGYVKIASADPDDAQAIVHLAPIYALAGVLPPEKVRALADAFGAPPEEWLQGAREDLAHTLTSLHAYWDDARQAAAERLRELASPPA